MREDDILAETSRRDDIKLAASKIAGAKRRGFQAAMAVKYWGAARAKRRPYSGRAASRQSWGCTGGIRAGRRAPRWEERSREAAWASVGARPRRDDQPEADELQRLPGHAGYLALGGVNDFTQSLRPVQSPGDPAPRTTGRSPLSDPRKCATISATVRTGARSGDSPPHR
jgi:hypothetical protein